MSTQEQANAIAEREYPHFEGGTATGKTLLLIQREAYAKALMDLNPLIEAGEEMYKAIDGIGIISAGKASIVWRTALSNLTKNIEP